MTFFFFTWSEIYNFFGVRIKHVHSLFFRAEALDTGSPDPRSSERRCLSSLSGTLSACPTSFLHTKFPSLKSQGYSQTLTPSIPRILEGADQSFLGARAPLELARVKIIIIIERKSFRIACIISSSWAMSSIDRYCHILSNIVGIHQILSDIVNIVRYC